jgi:hypothetical protein
LAARTTKSWETIRRQKPLNEVRVATYERLMDAQELIAEARSRRGVSQARIDDALAASELNDSEVESEDDLYLQTLARYVAALGGRVEVQAVFPDETINLLREPRPPGQH